MRGLMQENLFDVEAIEQVNAEIQQKKHQEENLRARKQLVNLPYFEHPKNDNELLFNYQYEYLKNDNQNAWGELLKLSFEVMQKLVWKRMAQEKKSLDNEEQYQKISEACFYILRRYQTRVGYCVTTNFITSLDKALDHAWKYTTKLEMNTVYAEDILQEKRRI